MKEIGGYIELEHNHMPLMHENAVALNCGRNCLAYLIRAKQIKKILLPYFLCASVRNVCIKENCKIRYYHIREDFSVEDVNPAEDEWLYVVNYYGQFEETYIRSLKNRYDKVILDQAQAYFQMPVPGVDTLYTCRKFFGVPDGGFLYTDNRMEEELETDESFERMQFLLGRLERSASEFYGEYAANNHFFETEPVKRMSKLTKNLLRGIDYDFVRQQRTENFVFLEEKLGKRNRLKLKVPEGAFAYPLWLENGKKVRKRLIEQKIYVPTLWPDVLKDENASAFERDMAENILPLPCDQRYGREEMEFMVYCLHSSESLLEYP